MRARQDHLLGVGLLLLLVVVVLLLLLLLPAAEEERRGGGGRILGRLWGAVVIAWRKEKKDLIRLDIVGGHKRSA